MPHRRLPLRCSLLSEVIAVLREGIITERWTERLPGERLLALELQVSRPTISLALKALEKQGLLESSAKKKRRIAHRYPHTHKVSGPVVLLSPVPLEFMEQHTILWVDMLRQSLAKLDNELIVLANRRAYSSDSEKFLEQVVGERPAACWVLTLSTRQMQEWFSKRGVAAVVAGSSFFGNALNSVDLDFQAVGRHAAGMLLSKGYQHICLVNRHPIHAGDKLTETGFCEAFEKRTKESFPPIIINHDGTPSGIRAAMERIWRKKIFPEAYFVTCANHVLSVVSFLAHNGLVHGKNYALISRDDDPFLGYLMPPIPCYRRDHVRFSKAILRLIQKAVGEPASPSSVQIMPDFKPSGNCA